jgi:uncharacterized membrane protein YkoI
MKVLTLLLALAAAAAVPASAIAATFPQGGYAPASAYSPNYMVTRAQAVQIALRAVGGGQVIQVQFEDYPRPMWQVEVFARSNAQYEVNVSARTGRVLAIIYQGNDG